MFHALGSNIPLRQHAHASSEYEKICDWAKQEQPALLTLSQGIPTHILTILSAALNALGGISLLIERDLIFSEVALARVVLESCGRCQWLLEAGITSTERAKRLVRDAAEENRQLRAPGQALGSNQDSLQDDDSLSPEEEAQEEAGTDRCTAEIAEWQTLLRLDHNSSIPDGINLVSRAVERWEHHLLSSLIHSRVFAVEVIHTLDRSDPEFQTDLAIKSGLAYLRTMKMLANFMLGDSTEEAPFFQQIRKLEGQVE